jgi:hypothetical protein
VPLTGWLTVRFGQVRLFLASTLLFILASWMCGLAPNMESLILFRVLQGLVAGPLIPLSQALLLSSYPRAKAGTALAMWSMTTLVAPIAGPLLGGWITDNYSWPWIFFINIPVGIAAVYATWSIYADRETVTRKLPIDAVGLGLLVVWIAALQIMLDKGQGARLVRQRPDREPGSRRSHGIRLFPDLGAHRGAPRRRSQALRRSQLHDGRGHDVDCLRRVLRLRRAAPALAADADGLHRDRGRLQSLHLSACSRS